MDAGRCLAVTEPRGWRFEPTLEDTLDREHPSNPINYSQFQLDHSGGAAKQKDHPSPHPPAPHQEAKTETAKNNPLFSLLQAAGSRYAVRNVWKYRHLRGKLKEMKQLKKKPKQLAASITAQHAASLSA